MLGARLNGRILGPYHGRNGLHNGRSGVYAGPGRLGSSSGGGDPFFSSVKLLIGNDNKGNTTTSIVDQSGSPKTITVNGNTQYSTTTPPTGLTSSLLLDGTGDYLTTPDSADFTFGSSDLTIEAWIRLTAAVNGWVLYAQDGQAAAFAPIVWEIAANRTVLYSSQTGAAWAQNNVSTDGGAILATGTWYHLALVKDAGTWRQYRDGSQQWNLASAGALMDSAASVSIGNQFQAAGGSGLNGNIASMRVTKGVCRYPNGTTFTPPSLPLQNS